ncbi:D-alanyl-D-alanine carboxypeptidase/D-alanyl-D-alanine-endopeptidase [Bacillus sp. JJ1609]
MLRQKTALFIVILSITILPLIAYFKPEDPPAQAFETSGELSKEINEILNEEPQLKGSLAGVSVRSAEDGELLYEHIGATRLQPASVMKLFTASAALSVLGEGYTFTTEVFADGKISGKTLEGDLYLKGKGDPTLLPDDFNKIAKTIKEKGIERIEGDLIADDTWYDDVRYSTDLSWTDEHEYYGSQISALTASPNKDYDSGTVILNIHPGTKKGSKAIISIEPNTDYVHIENQTKTVDAKGKYDIDIEREHSENTILVTGTIPADANKKKEWVAVWEPSIYAMDLLKRSFEVQGIKVIGKIKTGIAKDNMQQLISHKSMPLSELLIPFMKLSNNGHAEVLVKEMGKVVHDEGSWDKGLEVMNSELAEMGINSDQLVLRDGSGLSHANLVPANEITSLLYHVQKEKWYKTFQHSLPVAGASDRMTGGTMRSRMQTEPMKENVIAKTGSLTGVHTLAGYVKTSSGKTLIFAILLNNLLDDEAGKQIEDRIVEVLARQP